MKGKWINFRRAVLILLIHVASVVNCHADNEKALKNFRQGEDYFSDKKYEKALGFYRKALLEDRSDGSITIVTEKIISRRYGRDVVQDVQNDYRTEDYFPARRIAQIESILEQQAKKAEEEALPCNLVITGHFVDSNQIRANNTLDAGEDATLVISARNKGQGKGYETKLEVRVDNSEIEYQKAIDVGDILPGDEREIKVKLKASLDIRSGKTPIYLNLKEKRSFDSNKVQVNILTAKLDRPNLEIVSTEINDGDSGRAEGNGNGIPESGETIELVAYVKNNGEGDAISVKLQADRASNGLDLLQYVSSLETIHPGETAKAKIVFKIPRHFDSEKIAVRLKVADGRGVNDAEKKVEYAFGRLAPDVRYAWRFFSGDKEVETLTNGETYYADLVLKNTGKIAARDVGIRIDANGGAAISRSSIRVDEINAQSALPAERLKLTIPRTFSSERVVLSTSISQTDFSGNSSVLNIPVKTRQPKIKYVANLQRDNGVGAIIEQGEQATLVIQVLNEGMLSAEGVHVRVKSDDDNLKVLIKKEDDGWVSLGKIAPQSQGKTASFPIQATKRLESGQKFLKVEIKQNDFFWQKQQQFALNVQESSIDVIDNVVANDSTSRRNIVNNSAEPVINFKSKVFETEDKSFSLAFEVSDDKSSIDPASIKVVVGNEMIPVNVKPGFNKKQNIRVDLPLKEGENRIIVSVKNTGNFSSSKKLTVVRTADDINDPQNTGFSNPNAIAVVIGISKYDEKSGIPPVKYARNDAETMKKYLVNIMGFKSSNIMEFYDEKATSNDLRNYFEDELQNKLKGNKSSEIFVFYSGHGAPDTNTKEAYLLPYNYNKKSHKNTGLKVKDLSDWLQKLEAKNVTVVLDACFSGFSGDGKPLVENASSVGWEVTNPLLNLKNAVVLTSSSADQISSWYSDKEHGIFTYFFLKGIAGKADENNDGRITVGELETYLKRNVHSQAYEEHKRLQDPEVRGKKDAVLVKLRF